MARILRQDQHTSRASPSLTTKLKAEGLEWARVARLGIQSRKGSWIAAGFCICYLDEYRVS